MPKMKSHSGAKKRFRTNAAGKFKHEHPGQRHLMAPLGGKRRRFLRQFHSEQHRREDDAPIPSLRLEAPHEN